MFLNVTCSVLFKYKNLGHKLYVLPLSASCFSLLVFVYRLNFYSIRRDTWAL